MKGKDVAVTVTVTAFLIIGSFVVWLKPAETFSDVERRNLELFPSVSWNHIISGKFMTDFEAYALDQFPFRDALRGLKADVNRNLLGQRDNNGIYLADGYLSKMEYPMKEDSVERAAERFRFVYDRFLADKAGEVYFTIIPDKNYFLAEPNGYLSMDYDAFFDQMTEKTEFMEYIDITGLLDIKDYYRTDPHWRQENLVNVAGELAARMDVTISGEYETHTLDTPFYGVYYGQSALDVEAEELRYLSNDIIGNCVVYDYENNKTMGMYDMEKAYGKDPYEMFLSGALSLVTIENPNADTERELIIFRDSFGSSIAPLLAEGYRKTTLVDIRYLQPELLERYIEFDDRDVLFLYSTLVLNHSETLK